MLTRRLTEFLFPEVPDTWLTVLRIGLGLQVVAYCFSLLPDWNFVFVGSGSGLISRDVTETILTLDCPFLPRLSWFVDLGKHVGFSEGKVLSLILLCFLGSGCCLIAGLFCRTAAVVAWLLHLSSVTSGGLMSYGVDNFMTIG